jgi:branched-chain amino acid transport system substrate-binding protein
VASKRGGASAYTAAFKTNYKKEATYLEAAAIAGCEVLAQSVEKAGSTDPAAVRAQLSSLKFDTFYGSIKFGPTGQNAIDSPMILQIQDGKYIMLDPQPVKTGELMTGVGRR